MDFGIFNLMQQRGANVTSAELVDDSIRHTRIAESLGFGRAWFAEHHFSNYSRCPSPLMMVAHAAAVTERIRLGTAVIVAPLHMPARLLGEIGLADSLSGGRLDLGIGNGYQHFEFERFRVDIEERRERLFEMLDMIELGLTEKVFEYRTTEKSRTEARLIHDAPGNSRRGCYYDQCATNRAPSRRNMPEGVKQFTPRVLRTSGWRSASSNSEDAHESPRRIRQRVRAYGDRQILVRTSAWCCASKQATSARAQSDRACLAESGFRRRTSDHGVYTPSRRLQTRLGLGVLPRNSAQHPKLRLWPGSP